MVRRSGLRSHCAGLYRLRIALHTHTHTHTVIITRCKAKPDCDLLSLVFHHPLSAWMLWRCWLGIRTVKQEAQRSPSDRAMRLVSSNLANYHATVQKILIRQVLTKPMVWSWRFSWRQCVIKNRRRSSCVYHLYTDDLLWRNFLSPQCRNCSRDPDHDHLRNTHSSQD